MPPTEGPRQRLSRLAEEPQSARRSVSLDRVLLRTSLIPLGLIGLLAVVLTRRLRLLSRLLIVVALLLLALVLLVILRGHEIIFLNSGHLIAANAKSRSKTETCEVYIFELREKYFDSTHERSKRNHLSQKRPLRRKGPVPHFRSVNMLPPEVPSPVPLGQTSPMTEWKFYTPVFLLTAGVCASYAFLFWIITR